MMILVSCVHVCTYCASCDSPHGYTTLISQQTKWRCYSYIAPRRSDSVCLFFCLLTCPCWDATMYSTHTLHLITCVDGGIWNILQTPFKFVCQLVCSSWVAYGPWVLSIKSERTVCVHTCMYCFCLCSITILCTYVHVYITHHWP